MLLPPRHFKRDVVLLSLVPARILLNCVCNETTRPPPLQTGLCGPQIFIPSRIQLPLSRPRHLTSCSTHMMRLTLQTTLCPGKKQTFVISVKSINVCNSYSKFSDVTQKHGVHYWQRHSDETVKVQKSNILKFVFKIFSACLNASSTT